MLKRIKSRTRNLYKKQFRSYSNLYHVRTVHIHNQHTDRSLLKQKGNMLGNKIYYLKMRRMVLAIWFHECNLSAKSFSNSLQAFCFLINVSNCKTFCIVSWPAYICTCFPPNVFCSTTTLHLLLPPHLFTKSMGSLVEE